MDNYYVTQDINEYSEEPIIKVGKDKIKNKKTNKIMAKVIHVLKNKTIIQIDNFGFVIHGIYDKKEVEIEYEGTIGEDFKIVKIK